MKWFHCSSETVAPEMAAGAVVGLAAAAGAVVGAAAGAVVGLAAAAGAVVGLAAAAVPRRCRGGLAPRWSARRRWRRGRTAGGREQNDPTAQRVLEKLTTALHAPFPLFRLDPIR